MPIYTCQDETGYYFQYGNRGKKYYYVPSSKSSRDIAYYMALRQSQAVHARRKTV